MNTFTLTAAYLRHHALRTAYNVVFFAAGTALIATVLAVGSQFQNNLERNLHGIDMVVGAKGSPLQLVLSAVLQADLPTGNIPLEEANQLAQNHLVRQAIPMALGDNLAGYRIVGTTPAYIANYQGQLAAGRLFGTKPLEAVLGSAVAHARNLHVGQTFVGQHGLTPGGEMHSFAPYTVVGILKPTGTILDRLVTTPVESVWYVHENDDDEPASIRPSPAHREITALLIRFASPLAVVGLPRFVNAHTNMQAAIPAMEAFRLRKIMGMGGDTLKAVGALMVGLAGLGLLVSMAEAVRQRLYDLALLRCFGAPPLKLVALVALEGGLISLLGGLLGLGLSRFGAQALSATVLQGQLSQNASLNLAQNGMVLGGVLAVGLAGALLPALRIYRLNIPKLLASR